MSVARLTHKGAKKAEPVILNPDDVKGQYDSSRALETTLGGIKRQITAEDLEAFEKH